MALRRIARCASCFAHGREVGAASQEEVKLGVGYTINGEELPFGMMPSTLEDLASVEVVYESTCAKRCVWESCDM